MKRHMGVWLVLLTCACGSNNSKTSDVGTGGDITTIVDPNTTSKVTVSGVVAPLPFLAALDANDYAHVTVALIDPQAILANPNAALNFLGTTALDANTCTASGCPFSIADVDLATVEIGLAVGVIDSRLTDAPDTATLFPIFTGVAQTAVVAAQTSGSLTGAVAFAVGLEGYAQLANTTTDPNAVAINGLLIALALDGNDKPIANATMTTPQYTGHTWYPGLDGNLLVTAEGTTTAGPTSASGLIIFSPTTAGVSLDPGWTLAVVGSAATWTVPTPLGTAPGFALIVPLPPNP